MHLADEVLDHLFRHFEVGNDAVGHWSDSDDDDADEMAREEAENLYNRGIRRVRDNTTLSVDGCDFEWEYGDGPSILALFELEYNINMSEFTPEYGADVDDNDVESDILDRLKHKSDDIFTYPDVSLARVRSFVQNNTRTIVVVYEDTYYSADEFYGVCNDLVRWMERNNEEQLEKTFMEVLQENGILKVADNESVGVRFRNFARYIGNNSNYFDTEIKNQLIQEMGLNPVFPLAINKEDISKLKKLGYDSVVMMPSEEDAANRSRRVRRGTRRRQGGWALDSSLKRLEPARQRHVALRKESCCNAI